MKVIKINEKDLHTIIRKVISEEKNKNKDFQTKSKITEEFDEIDEVEYKHEGVNYDSMTKEDLEEELETLKGSMINLYDDASDYVGDVNQYETPLDLARALKQIDIGQAKLLRYEIRELYNDIRHIEEILEQ
jgi:hypothetical protein